MATYLLLEDGSKIILEDSSGFILLEVQDVTAPSGVPGGRSRRIEVQRRNGEIISVDSEYDLQRILSEIVRERDEKPKPKRSKKVKRAFEQPKPTPDFRDNELSALLAIMAEQANQRVTEAALWALVTDMMLKQAQEEEEITIILLCS